MNKSYFASLGHRLSGIALALFLPFHFLLLGTALSNEASFDKALAFTSMPVVKFAEWGLVVLLAVHLLFGLRVLLLELTDWPNGKSNKQSWVIPMLLLAFVIGMIFWVRAG